MMSKERELLKQSIEMIKIVPMMSSIGNVPPDFASELILEIQELLAQPEQEPEPVAWMQDSVELYVLEEKSAIRGYVIPLYTSPPKREPIDTRRITLKMFSEGADMQYKNGYVDGIRFAEKMHGIGGGE